eukprot:CAMPEP_0118660462 /NCGR_PEP_ID=MMETSP0785-20121206/15697_1 /TAXON_ID=91992 /ORGANISM="Bolidomonas pacifica, Strain CCMP 1866" /LENGTH=59 /DNA_ID=CAMNT_0006553713 /DNA_START=97 /DNA_END=273 /DNA_ORIENTATION=-
MGLAVTDDIFCITGPAGACAVSTFLRFELGSLSEGCGIEGSTTGCDVNDLADDLADDLA